MATGAAGQTISTETEVFNESNDGGKCAVFYVICHTGSAASALVRVPGLHQVNEAAGVPAGVRAEFQLGNNGIAQVFIAGSGGTATVSYGVSARHVLA